MRILFLSDIHGVPSALEAAFQSAATLGYDKIVLLGDLLYHGPRNGVPDFYDPVKVAQMLNLRKDKIVAVRGNCDAEVDQMVLAFPVLRERRRSSSRTDIFGTSTSCRQSALGLSSPTGTPTSPSSRGSNAARRSSIPDPSRFPRAARSGHLVILTARN